MSEHYFTAQPASEADRLENLMNLVEKAGAAEAAD